MLAHIAPTGSYLVLAVELRLSAWSGLMIHVLGAAVGEMERATRKWNMARSILRL